MHKFVLVFVALLIQSQYSSFAQTLNPETTEYRYWIYFRDKGIFKPEDKIEPGSEAYKTAVSGLSEKALWRRSKVKGKNELAGYLDLPVFKDYIDKVKSLGVYPNSVSKWFNAVSINAVKSKLDEIIKLPFVEKIEGVHFLRNSGFQKSYVKQHYLPQNFPFKTNYDYGYSYRQEQQINVPLLHNFGITGYGVTIGMCDDGFNWRNHRALKQRRVIGEYDWIFRDDSTSNQSSPNQIPADSWDQDVHGTSTFSTIGGFYQGELIGPAFDADFYLSKTENDASETPVEEDYYLEALEWMEAKGVEVVSSSLIYKPYDPPNNSYNYKDMNGKTTVIVRAASIAESLGVVVLNSMGNEYQTDPPSIVSPPDGESVISVGAVDSAGEIAVFSSNGPTSDGRTKPDVVAMGVDVYTALSKTSSEADSLFSYSSGTSFSCPLTAGVCALMLSAHPELTPEQVKEALRMTANNKDKPNNTYGWGLINAYEAALYYGMIMSNKPDINESEGKTEFSIDILSKNVIDSSSVKLMYTQEGYTKSIQMILAESLDETNSGRYKAIVPLSLSAAPFTFYFSAADNKTEITAPYNAPQKFFYINPNSKQIEIF